MGFCIFEIMKSKNTNGKQAKKDNVYVSFTMDEFRKFANDLMKVSKAIDKAKKRVKVAKY